MNWEDIEYNFMGFWGFFFLNLNFNFIYEFFMRYELFIGCILLDKFIKDLE